MLFNTNGPIISLGIDIASVGLVAVCVGIDDPGYANIFPRIAITTGEGQFLINTNGKLLIIGDCGLCITILHVHAIRGYKFIFDKGDDGFSVILGKI